MLPNKIAVKEINLDMQMSLKKKSEVMEEAKSETDRLLEVRGHANVVEILGYTIDK